MRPSTIAALSPSRTIDESARSPISSLQAESSAVLPAPVSPVKTVNPAQGLRAAERISARFVTSSSSIIATHPIEHTRDGVVEAFGAVVEQQDIRIAAANRDVVNHPVRRQEHAVDGTGRHRRPVMR